MTCCRDFNNSQWAAFAHGADGGPMSACHPNTVSLPPKHGIQPMATDIKPISCLRSVNEALHMICSDVNSQFGSRKLNNAAKLTEKKHKPVRNRCILKSGLIN